VAFGFNGVVVGDTYRFTATVSHDAASGPFVFTWNISNVSAVRQVQGTTASVDVAWNSAGEQTVAVTVTGGCGSSVSDTVQITITGGQHTVYLPIVLRAR
jgi:hypothetical protein